MSLWGPVGRWSLEMMCESLGVSRSWEPNRRFLDGFLHVEFVLVQNE